MKNGDAGIFPVYYSLKENTPSNLLVVVVVVSHIQRIGCQPEENYFTRWPIPLVVC